MQRTAARVPLMLAIAQLAGCRVAGSEHLQGHWRGVRAEGVSPDAASAANAFAAGMDLSAKGDTLAITTPRERQSGRYRVIFESPTKLVITTEKDATPETFTFVDSRTVKWSVSDGRAIVFVKE